MILSTESKRRFHQMLLKMRQELYDEARGQDPLPGERNYVGDLGDYASSDMAAEYAYMLRDRRRERLLLIEEALDALDNGEYGICEECEEPINERRLLLMPFTRVCVRCQSEIERRAKLRERQVAGAWPYRSQE